MNLNEVGKRKELLAGFDEEPSFVRRARHAEDAGIQFIAQCQFERNQLLEIPKMRLAVLVALIDSNWGVLEKYMKKEEQDALFNLYNEWSPKLKSQFAPTNSQRKIRQALKEMMQSFVRFNKKWEAFLMELDFARVNTAREDYNKYFVLEKACFFQSERIAYEGFEELLPFTLSELMEQFPFLGIVAL